MEKKKEASRKRGRPPLTPEQKAIPLRDKRGVRIQREHYGNDKYIPIDQIDNKIMIETLKQSIGEGDYSPKGPGGQPPKIKSKEDLINRINKYIAYINDINTQAGDMYLYPDVEGFCVFNMMGRDALYDMRNRPEYSDYINSFLAATANIKKRLAESGKIPGLIFTVDANNNFGYVQQQKIDITATAKMQTLPDASNVADKLDIIDGDARELD